MMQRGIIRSICSYNFIIFLLCLIEVSSAPAQQHETNILNSMRQDENLQCKNEKLLPWDHIKVCENITYPAPGTIKLSLFDTDTLLCLGVYDAFYKACNYSNHNLIDLSTETQGITDVINDVLVKNKTEQMKTTFCKNLKGLTPSYEKTKSLLSMFVNKLNEPNTCSLICFGYDNNPSPLCGILAWSKSIGLLVEQNLKQDKMNDALLRKQNAKDTSSHTTVIESPRTEKQLETERLKPEQQPQQHEQQQTQPQQQPQQQIQNQQQPQQQIQNQQQPQQQIQNQQQPQQQKQQPQPQKHQPQSQEQQPQQEKQQQEQKTQQLQQEQPQEHQNQQDNSQQLQPRKEEQTNRLKADDALNTHQEMHTGAIEPPKPNKVETSNSGTLTDPQKNPVDADFKPASIPNKKTVQEPVANVHDVSNYETPSNLAPSKSEIKYTTISENTQEHDIGNVEDRNHSLEAQMSSDDISEPPTDIAIQSKDRPEPSEQREPLPRYHSITNDEDSHFFTYFTIISLLCIAGYIGYHNKQKVLAIVLEGRRSRSSRSRRRPSTASYRKLDCTLEEAVTSQCNANVTHVIY